MKKMFVIPAILSLFSLLFSASCASLQDFCVADYSSQPGPSGYTCKDPSKVKASDFIYSGLGVPGNTSNLIKAGITTAFYDQFPGINGQGISFARADLAPGGVIPFHYHHRAAEMALVIKGTLRVGILSSDNKVYLNTLKEGDIMIFPQGMPHFQINVGKSDALFFVGFNSENPGVEIVPYALFSNNLPTELINTSTFISTAEIKRLKALLGGTG